MIKKFTLCLAFIAMVLNAKAALDVANATLNWNHSFQGLTSAGNSPISIDKLSDGNYLFFGEWGSKTDEGYQFLAFDNEMTTIKGGLYSGTSYCANLLLQKLNPSTGAEIWKIYSNYGYISSSNSIVKATSDGGFILCAKTRAVASATDLDKKKILSLVQGDGTVADITLSEDLYMGTNFSEYCNVIVKFNKDGMVQWNRVIKDKVLTDRTYTSTENSYVYGMDIDDNDNVYLVGNIRSEMYVLKSDGSVATLVCTNTSAWNGDSQGTVGEMMVIKLNSDGYYVSSLQGVGDPSCSYLDNVVYGNGKLYVNGRVLKGANDVTFGGKDIDASASFQTMFLASINTSDLSVNYVNTLTTVKNSSNKFVIQNKNAQYVDGKVYFTGLLNGGLAKSADDDAFITNGATLLKSYVLRMDAATGSVDASSCYQTSKSISGYFGVYVGTDKVVTSGYDMGTGAGHVFTVLNKETLALEESVVVCSGFGSIAAIAKPLQDGGHFIVGNRGKATTSTATILGAASPIPFVSKSSWAAIYMDYTLDSAVPTSISGITTDANVRPTNYNVYSITGTLVKTASNMSDAVEGLNSGIYIVNGKKIAIK